MFNITIHQQIAGNAQPSLNWGLWWRWVVANAFAEALGLGSTLLLIIVLALNAENVLGPLGIAGLSILGGTLIEGLLVGTAQWLVLRRVLQKMRWWVWALATAAGACIAWTIGMIPSTFIFTGADTGGGTSPASISDALIYALAFLMGLALGPMLGVPQWLVLRHYVPKAGWWVLANSLAWGLGMVVVFIGTNVLSPTGITIGIATGLALFLLAAGATVGAIHGLVLIWLLRKSQKPSQNEATPLAQSA